MSLSNGLVKNPAHMRVLSKGKLDPQMLAQRTCLRCGKSWWPRAQNKPKRCPGCKNPYWDQPRREREPPTPRTYEALTKALQEKVARKLGMSVMKQRQDHSLAKALAVLKEMKADGRTWQDMTERVEREFEVRLDKEQLKALVR